jgi:hypothetical protein
VDELPRRDVDLAAFTRTTALVQSYVRGEPGAYSALLAGARQDPAGTTAALVALGTVLLDMAAGVFQIPPDQMLAKVCAGIRSHADASA